MPFEVNNISAVLIRYQFPNPVTLGRVDLKNDKNINEFKVDMETDGETKVIAMYLVHG